MFSLFKRFWWNRISQWRISYDWLFSMHCGTKNHRRTAFRPFCNSFSNRRVLMTGNWVYVCVLFKFSSLGSCLQFIRHLFLCIYVYYYYYYYVVMYSCCVMNGIGCVCHAPLRRRRSTTRRYFFEWKYTLQKQDHLPRYSGTIPYSLRRTKI